MSKSLKLIEEYNSIVKANNLFEDIRDISFSVSISTVLDLKGSANTLYADQIKKIKKEYIDLSYAHKLDNGYTERAAKGIPRQYKIYEQLIKLILGVKFGDTIEIRHQGKKEKFLLNESNITNNCIYSKLDYISFENEDEKMIRVFANGYKYNKTKKPGLIKYVIAIIGKIDGDNLVFKDAYCMGRA